jgi:hypothetical protein
VGHIDGGALVNCHMTGTITGTDNSSNLAAWQVM